MRQVVIRDSQLELRYFCDNDIAEHVQAVLESKNTVGTWMPWWKPDYSEVDSKLWFDRCKEMQREGIAHEFGIFDTSTRELYGGVGINGIDQFNKIGNLGYWIKESAQGHGIATRAASLCLKFAIEKLALVRIEIVVHEHNTASQSVANNLGADFECNLPNRLMHQGKPNTAKMYSILSS